jgi:hypothetical protein
MLLKKLKVSSAKSLSSRMETQVVAVTSKKENGLWRGSLARAACQNLLDILSCFKKRCHLVLASAGFEC